MQNPINPTDYNELERQTERACLFTHTVLSEQIGRQNETDAFLYGLIDYLTRKGIVLPEELQLVVADIKKEVIEKQEYANLGAAIRIDEDADTVFQPVNCSERLHICNAVCCKLSFPLSVEEIEAGLIKWDLGKPYQIRHQGNGYCHHLKNDDGYCCSVYENRPSVCSKYSCSNDQRIWTDFDNMVLNQEWIDNNLYLDNLVLTAMF